MDGWLAGRHHRLTINNLISTVVFSLKITTPSSPARSIYTGVGRVNDGVLSAKLIVVHARGHERIYETPISSLGWIGFHCLLAALM